MFRRCFGQVRQLALELGWYLSKHVPIGKTLRYTMSHKLVSCVTVNESIHSKLPISTGFEWGTSFDDEKTDEHILQLKYGS